MSLALAETFWAVRVSLISNHAASNTSTSK